MANYNAKRSPGGTPLCHCGAKRLKVCPRCGEKSMCVHSRSHGALSRVVKAYICSECGLDEAMKYVQGAIPMPPTVWARPDLLSPQVPPGKRGLHSE